MLTVFELITMFIEEDTQEFEIYDIDKGRTVWNGFLSDLPNKFADKTVVSIDNLGTNGTDDVLTVNI